MKVNLYLVVTAVKMTLLGLVADYLNRKILKSVFGGETVNCRKLSLLDSQLSKVRFCYSVLEESYLIVVSEKCCKLALLQKSVN